MVVKQLQESRGSKIARSMTLVLVSTVLTGCATNQKTSSTDDLRIYFSHSYATLPSKRPNSLSGAGATQTLKFAEKATGASNEIVLFFENDSAELRQGDVEHLQSYLMDFEPKNYPIFMITGHTDSNHTDIYNLKLSERRAERAQQMMLRMGVPEVLTTVRAVGEHSPVASNETPNGRQSNRRVTIKAIP